MDESEFMSLLLQTRESRDRELSARFSRSLPFGDAVFDRWKRAEKLGFGDGASVYDSAFIFGDVTVGEHTWIGPNVLLDGSGGRLAVGAWCSVSAGVQIYTHTTVAWALTGGRAAPSKASVTIEDCCYIGPLSIITAGVAIGTRSIIGANSFVNRDVPAHSMVVGSPAREIGHVHISGETLRVEYIAHERGPGV